MQFTLHFHISVVFTFSHYTCLVSCSMTVWGVTDVCLTGVETDRTVPYQTRIGCSAEHMCHLPWLFQKIDKGE